MQLLRERYGSCIMTAEEVQSLAPLRKVHFETHDLICIPPAEWPEEAEPTEPQSANATADSSIEEDTSPLFGTSPSAASLLAHHPGSPPRPHQSRGPSFPRDEEDPRGGSSGTTTTTTTTTDGSTVSANPLYHLSNPSPLSSSPSSLTEAVRAAARKEHQHQQPPPHQHQPPNDGDLSPRLMCETPIAAAGAAAPPSY
eukprot:TRINITY_DN19460_c0_g1_i1.p1 TRINITY_DN19460_c0_g1~~TRINITY_DN19460_c0_g1_i1.p1  ORF type:complete len:198 (+),score=19.60 TRINITY_DN19460_c0_g1_i1:73-666(+)